MKFMSKPIKETPVLWGHEAKVFNARLNVDSFLHKWGMITSNETGGHVKYNATIELYEDTKNIIEDIKILELEAKINRFDNKWWKIW